MISPTTPVTDEPMIPISIASAPAAPGLRRAAAIAASLLLVLGCLPLPAFAQAPQPWPSRPLRIVVGFTAGGPVDLVARIVSPRLSAQLGQPVLVENRPGADANIAMETVARANPDGHTLLLIQPGVAINPPLYRKVPFDPIRDFAPISLIGESPNIVAVYNGLPANTMQELVALARAKKGGLFYGATSSPTHLATELLNTLAGVQTVRVPFKGAPPALAALMSGEVQIVLSSIGTLLPLSRAGKVRALAVTSAKRSAVAPELPTVQESGVPGFVATTWYGLAATGGTPRPVIDRRNADLRKVLAEPEVRSQLAGQGIDEPSPGTPEQLAALISRELVKWEKVVRASGAAIN
jgi:tripartite-type tricarboxylate transporter receptor subunit TctC